MHGKVAQPRLVKDATDEFKQPASKGGACASSARACAGLERRAQLGRLLLQLAVLLPKQLQVPLHLGSLALGRHIRNLGGESDR